MDSRTNTNIDVKIDSYSLHTYRKHGSLICYSAAIVSSIEGKGKKMYCFLYILKSFFLKPDYSRLHGFFVNFSPCCASYMPHIRWEPSPDLI